MRVTLSNDRWAEIRDVRTRGDRIAAKTAIKVHTNADGGRDMDVAVDDHALGALLARMIVAWSPELGPMPSQCANPIDALDQLPDEDAQRLEDAIRPHYDAILGKKAADPKPAQETPRIVSGSVLSTSTSADGSAPSTSSSSNGTGTPAPSLGLPPR